MKKSGDPGIFTLPNSSFIQCGSLAMPYTLYLGMLYSHSYHSKETPSHLSLPIKKKLFRVLIFGLLISTAYLPYIVFFHHFSSHVIQAMIFTIMLPLSLVCFVGSAWLEKYVYLPLGLSTRHLKIQ